MDPLGIECALRHQDDYRGRPQAVDEELVAFFAKHFRI